MMMRVISFFLVFATLTVNVQASTKNGLKAAFDELNYALSVEWDQRDQEFFNNQSEAFTKEILKLQRAGVSNQEILESVLNELHDKNLARDIRTTYSLVSINALSPEEAEAQVKLMLQNSYQKGASWNGGSVLLGMVLVIAIIAVVGIIYQEELKKKGEQCYMAWKCNESCTLTGCQQVCGEECI